MTQWDVLVAGGGPAGMVCAIELARHERRVLLLEAEHPPRYRIGESLSPTACAVLAAYDVDLDAAGFVGKTGATLVWGERGVSSTYYPHSAAWQVRRDELDTILLERAGAAGVQVQTGARVERVQFDGDRVVGVSWVTASGGTAQASPRWFVDATGRDALLSRDRGLLVADPALSYHAVWGYWRGGSRLPGRAAGNTLLVGGDPAWWYLPVGGDGDLIGVGRVSAGPAPGQDPTAAYQAAVAGAPVVKELLATASRVGPVRWEPAEAQVAGALCGPNWVLVGDAAGFVDPLLTPGVQLAVESGQWAGRIAHAALDRPDLAPALGREYDRRFQRQYETYRWLATNMYAAGTRFPVEPPLATVRAGVADGDEQADRLTFLSVISGLPASSLPPLLGRYLEMRGAACRYGAAPPVFGETEGFAFLSWVLRTGLAVSADPPPAPPELTAASTVRLASGAGIDEIKSIADGAVHSQSAAYNRAGERYLLTSELAALLRLLAGEPSYSELARGFAKVVGGAPDEDAFRGWLQALSQHGLVACPPEVLADTSPAVRSAREASPPVSP